MNKEKHGVSNDDSQTQSIRLGRYKHYKGGEYRVQDIAIHSETEQLMVVYRPLYGDKNLWVRPLTMFNELVEHNGQQTPRFSFLE
jgi:hypothetical protein